MRRVAFCLSLLSVAVAVRLRAQSTAVDGVIFDSLSHTPLAGARVQLFGPVGNAAAHLYAVVSDSAGHFHFDALARGRYDAGFFHTTLDGAGIELPTQQVNLQRDREKIVLATPSGARLTKILCPDAKLADSTATLVGYVRDASIESPLAGARVRAEWTVTTIGNNGIGTSAFSATTEATLGGWFALCSVPSETPLSIRAQARRDSSGVVQVEIAANEVHQVALYVAHSVTGSDSTRAAAVVGRLIGTVTDERGRPLAAAHVTVWETSVEVTTDAQGAFTADSVPAGSRTVEVRAIGSAPALQFVNLLSGQTTHVSIALQHAVTLETVETRAETEDAILLAPFERHKKSAAGGFFIRPTERDRQGANPLQRWARMAPGVKVEPKKSDANRWHALMYPPGPRGGQPTCDPTIFVNGVKGIVDFDDIISIYTANDILGFEIYSNYLEVPSDYHVDPLHACGVISIWVRMDFSKADKKPPA